MIRGPANPEGSAGIYFNGREYDNTADLERFRASLRHGIDKNLYAPH